MAVILRQIKPDNDSVLMGLEKEGFSVFPGCESFIEIPVVNGQYNIGLNDNEKLKQTFEKYFGVQFDTPEGQEFLSNYQIKINHDVMSFDPKNVKDLFELHILKVNNGMGLIATSDYAIEETPINTFKWILKDEEGETQERVKKKEIKIAAIKELSKLYESNTNRLVLLAKYMFSAASGIGSNKVLAFDKMEDFISKSTKNAQSFLDTCKKDPEYIDTVVKVREAMFRNIIRLHNGQYVLFATQTPLGRNEEEVLNFCLNPANKDIVGYGTNDDLPTSISSQLKQYEN